jgi:RNA polymerase sigma factor (sigma-70 family)
MGEESTNQLKTEPVVLSEEDILLLIACADTEEEKKIAFRKFYSIFVEDVYRMCRRILRSFSNGNQLVESAVQNTFMKVYDHAEQFNSDGVTDSERMRNKIKAWLYGIAKNEAYAELKIMKSDFVPIEDTASIADEPTTENVFKSANRRLLDEALENVLTDRERDILMMYMFHKDINNPNSHLPDEAIKSACQYWGTTPQNLRTIKSRALKAIKKYIDQRTSQQS